MGIARPGAIDPAPVRAAAQRRAASGSYFGSRGRPAGPGKIGAAGRCGRDRGAAGLRPDPLPIKAREWVCRSEPRLRRDLAVPRPPTETPARGGSRHRRPTTSLPRGIVAPGAGEFWARRDLIELAAREHRCRPQKITARVLGPPTRCRATPGLRCSNPQIRCFGCWRLAT